MIDLDQLRFDADGLIPGIVQAPSGQVRMLGYLNAESIRRTEELGRVTFFSRSRQRLWTKGEESGNFLRFLAFRRDCDGDALLITAIPEGSTCHTGSDSCFGDSPPSLEWLSELEQLLVERRRTAATGGSLDTAGGGSYTQRLFAAGVDRIGKKVIEEAGEVVIAAKNLPREREAFLGEAADLLFHLQLLLVAEEASLAEVVEVLRRRHR